MLKAARKDTEWQATLQAVQKGTKEVDKNLTTESVDENQTTESGLLLWKNRWLVPKDETLRAKVLDSCHNSKLAGHFGTFKTLK